jgi:beta-lactamase class A
MKNKSLLALLVIALFTVSASAQARRSFAGAESAHAASLQELVNDAARTALAKFADQKLTQEQLSVTLIDLRDPNHPVTASFRGNERVYPASVVKLFYLGAVHPSSAHCARR